MQVSKENFHKRERNICGGPIPGVAGRLTVGGEKTLNFTFERSYLVLVRDMERDNKGCSRRTSED
jgi:hypothetical protein